MDRVVAPFGLTHAQYSVLASLHAISEAHEPPTQSRLSDFMGLTPIYVSKLVRALEVNGNLKREPDPKDSRAFRLVLTKDGHSRIAAARDAVRRLDEKLTEPLGSTEGPAAREFFNTLKTLIKFHQQMEAHDDTP